MAQQEIDIGSFAGDGTGDPLREAFTKINENFAELYSGNVQVTDANVLVYSVAGRTGNVVLNVNDISQAASKSYVDNSISANLANVTNTITNSLNANIIAANAVISNHSAQITTLENNAAVQATAISNLNNTRATIAYVDQSIDLALSSNAILADVTAVNANVSAANAAILTKANLSGAIFTGNVRANTITSNYGMYASGQLFVGNVNPESYQNLAGAFTANVEGPFQLVLQNKHPGPQSSGDIVITADDGNDLTNYINIGINSSQWVNYWEGTYLEFPHDGYFSVIGGNAALRSDNSLFLLANTSIIKLEKDGDLQLATCNLRFSDGSIQRTAAVSGEEIQEINANITAANIEISILKSSSVDQSLLIDELFGNAAIQNITIDTLVANASSQAQLLNIINANIGAYQIFSNANASAQSLSINEVTNGLTAANSRIITLTANSVVQALELDNLQSNAQAQQGNIIALQNNTAVQASSINLINANVNAANSIISILTSTTSTQTTQINLLNANVTAANIRITSLTANAAEQASSIDNLYSNINVYLSNVASSNANITAANARIIIIDANLGSTTTNVTVLQNNAATQASQIDLLNANLLASNISKANLSGAIFSGNVQANYLISNANVKIASILEVGEGGPTDFPFLASKFIGNTAGYYQLVLQNLSDDPSSSGDIVVTANDGTDDNYYLNIGINNSNWSGNFVVPAGDTNLQEFAHDGYFTCIGGNTALRSDNNVFFVANTAAVGLFKDGDLALLSGNLRFRDGSILTNANIGDAPYLPNNVANYNGTITNVQQALDELAARLRALGG